MDKTMQEEYRHEKARSYRNSAVFRARPDRSRRVRNNLFDREDGTQMIEKVTIDDIAALPREFLRAEDVAPYLGIHPQSIRSQAQADPSKLGFPVIVHGTRVKIPRDGFVYFCKYGHLHSQLDAFVLSAGKGV